MAAQPVIGMPPGEVVAVFKKIHAPNGIAPVSYTHLDVYKRQYEDEA